MTFNALIAVFGLTGILFFIAAVRSIRRRRVAHGLLSGVASLALFLIAACAANEAARDAVGNWH